jgi:hypothetical protein
MLVSLTDNPKYGYGSVPVPPQFIAPTSKDRSRCRGVVLNPPFPSTKLSNIYEYKRDIVRKNNP